MVYPRPGRGARPGLFLRLSARKPVDKAGTVQAVHAVYAHGTWNISVLLSARAGLLGSYGYCMFHPKPGIQNQ